MVAMPSDLQVFVKWKEQTVFAGEDVECTITFKNVAESVEEKSGNARHQHPLQQQHHQQQQQNQQQHQRRASRPLNILNGSNDGYFTSKSSPTFSFFNGSRRSVPPSPRRPTLGSHRVSASLSSPLTGSYSFPPLHTPSQLHNSAPSKHQHKRSVSILSIESDHGAVLDKSSGAVQSPRSRSWGHGRSASLQIPPRQTSSGLDDILNLGTLSFCIQLIC